MFKNLNFVLIGKVKGGAFQKSIQAEEGKVTKGCNEKTNYLVVPNDFENGKNFKKNKQLQNAIKNNTPIVRVSFVEECIKEKKLVPCEKYLVKRETVSDEPKLLVSLDPIAGTRDFFPDEMRVRNWLINKWKETARVYGFEEYDSPILEPTLLYTTKSGDEICSQMYNFEDKSNQSISLRPEMTPSLARLIMKAGSSLILPVKWFSVPQCWRWETTTRGRKREFYQWNMDILGLTGTGPEAEIIASIISFLKSVGLTSKDCAVRVSSRKILEDYVNETLGLKKQKGMFLKICAVVDKVLKLPREGIQEMLANIGLDEKKIEKIFAFVDVKNVEDLHQLAEGNKKMIKSIEDVENLLELMDGYGMKDWILFDPSIVRGLAYYTGVVFEVFVKEGIQRAIAGGGRYDSLLQAFGEKRVVPAVGYGLGDVVIMEILKDKGIFPQLQHRVDDFIIYFNNDLRNPAIQMAMKLREKGRIVDVAMKRYRKIANAFSYADRIGAERVFYVAPSEYEKGMVRVKYLRRSENETKEEDIKIEDL